MFVLPIDPGFKLRRRAAPYLQPNLLNIHGSRCPQLSCLLDYHLYPHQMILILLRVPVSTCQ
ncbi:hypothetical protein K503DRAFT_773559 [Rhizopogon vinicolor AM-OR11-026]|uniref:Uncharacterized protein n=1 Tax=Rhizopogon vinicolor AM-OR11-026 TaxID=1314800 RepID=A0A1B7MS57_9AGAM|nr:hypothetical protein K503DRAFT_773559 [Rhizopogon vinicolor AM-OR11-026]